MIKDTAMIKTNVLDRKDYCHSEDIWSVRLGNVLKTIYPNVIKVTATEKVVQQMRLCYQNFQRDVPSSISNSECLLSINSQRYIILELQQSNPFCSHQHHFNNTQ